MARVVPVAWVVVVAFDEDDDVLFPSKIARIATKTATATIGAANRM